MGLYPSRPDQNYVFEDDNNKEFFDAVVKLNEHKKRKQKRLERETSKEKRVEEEREGMEEEEEESEGEGELMFDIHGISPIRASLLDVGRNAVLKAKGGKKSDIGIRTKFKNSYFFVRERDCFDDNGERINTEVEIVCKDINLYYGVLISFDVFMKGNYEEKSGFFGMVKKYPIISAASLLMRLNDLQNYNYSTPALQALMKWAQHEYVVQVGKIERFLSEGKVSYDGLWYLFERGNRFFTTVGKNQLVGSATRHARYTSTMFSQMFAITGEFVKSNGHEFFNDPLLFAIREFKGLVDIDSLDVKPMNQGALDILTKRGKIFRTIALGNHFKYYDSFLVTKKCKTVHYTKADGRVMVDIATFNRMNPEYSEFVQGNMDPDVQQQVNLQTQVDNMSRGGYAQQGNLIQGGGNFNRNVNIEDEDLYRTWPTVAGFSFSAKTWGEIVIQNLSEIEFDDDAYDRLVLQPEKKSLIQALVEDNKAFQEVDKIGFTDIITGKGGGVIFLLHGSPGVGKTLTAEAIAELLHRPLYSVSVGELGTSPKSLEQALDSIFEMASVWHSVVLIDEADIFLEKREQKDIIRNAMVGIFLKKLEYHQGVLFLTTNRITCFDPAFESRISVTIKYDDLDADTRKTVWHNLLESSGCYIDLPEDLYHNDLNGRQIRNIIRLSVSLARSMGEEFGLKHITATMETALQFGDHAFSSNKDKLRDSAE